MKDLVVCKFAGCNQVYTDARILPCGKRTCAAHIDGMMVKSDDNINCDDRKMLKCHFCAEIHSFPENGKEFLVDEYVPLLLNMRHCREHDAAKRSFNDVSQLLGKLTSMDNESHVIDYFDRVEADILHDREVNMQKLVAYYQQLVDEVHERKTACLQNLKTANIQTKLEAAQQTFVENACKLKTDNVDFILKTLDGDEDKWKEIQAQCGTMLETIKALGEELNQTIIGDQTIEFSPSTSDSQIDILYGHIVQVTIDSTILNSYKMKSDLVQLCKLRGKQFELIYRATRDGFSAADFHANHEPRTLTVIKTTNGYVFGVFVEVAWDSNSLWKADPCSFLFSLVNARSTPLLMPVIVGNEYSMYCNPDSCILIGACDIRITPNSNKTTDSYSNLGRSYDFKLFGHGTSEAKLFLAGSYNFQTSEIEIFQLN